jgi:hypothetical protein
LRNRVEDIIEASESRGGAVLPWPPA